MTEMKLQVFKGIKVPILNEHIWENFFRNKNRKLLKTEISIGQHWIEQSLIIGWLKRFG